MKIEKISDSQIRCTLTHADLSDRNLQFSDLVFRKDNAKSLFEDIMLTAQKQFNFSAGEGPLMIEALPNSDESITLVFTKVDESSPLLAETFGTPPSNSNGDNNVKSSPAIKLPVHEDGFSCLLGSSAFNAAREREEELESPKKKRVSRSAISKMARESHIFSFRTFQEVLDCVRVIGPSFSGNSMLHIDNHNDLFILTLSQSKMEHGEFIRVCNNITEFGIIEVCNEISIAYLDEHCKCVLAKSAVDVLLSL